MNEVTLIENVHSDPDPPTWRSTRDRRGAPLWRLVDFAADCDAAIRDRVEAALLASGLLDAWFADDGALTLPDGVADVLVDTTLPSVAAASLEAVLRPLDEATVPVEMTRRFLRAVAFAPTAMLPDASTVIGADGSFRIGTLVGRGTAVQASFIGAAAQERRRLARIAEIDRELASLSDQLAALAVRSTEIGDRVTRLDSELATTSSARLSTRPDSRSPVTSTSRSNRPRAAGGFCARPPMDFAEAWDSYILFWKPSSPPQRRSSRSPSSGCSTRRSPGPSARRSPIASGAASACSE